MNIIDFYKELSKLLERTREKFLSHEEAQEKLNELLKEINSVTTDKNINAELILKKTYG